MPKIPLDVLDIRNDEEVQVNINNFLQNIQEDEPEDDQFSEDVDAGVFHENHYCRW